MTDTTSESEVFLTPERSDATAAKRSLNCMTHEVVSPYASDLIGFWCECDDPECHKVCWLTADAFERGCVNPTWHALAPGHQAAVTQ